MKDSERWGSERIQALEHRIAITIVHGGLRMIVPPGEFSYLDFAAPRFRFKIINDHVFIRLQSLPRPYYLLIDACTHKCKSTIFRPTPQRRIQELSLLTSQNAPVSHLAIAQSIHGLLNTFPGQGELHRGRDDLLLSGEPNQRPKAVPGCNQRPLDTNSLDIHHEQWNGRRREVDSQRVDGAVNVHQRGQAGFHELVWHRTAGREQEGLTMSSQCWRCHRAGDDSPA